MWRLRRLTTRISRLVVVEYSLEYPAMINIERYVIMKSLFNFGPNLDFWIFVATATSPTGVFFDFDV